MVIIPDKPAIHHLAPAWYQPYVQRVDMLRLDLLHPDISGNKWFKLKHNIAFALDKGYTSILTFGGGYSNHLAATSAAARAYNVKAIAVVRGVYNTLTPTLQFCSDNGMQLHFVSQEDYAKKEDAEWLHQLSIQFNNPYIIPEGGANEQGRKGAEEIASHIPSAYTHICVSVGTGTTMAGICSGLNNERQTVYGYVPMKGGLYLEAEIARQVGAGTKTHWQLLADWPFGGFGKSNDVLISFMNEFYEANKIPLDVVYTAKMMYGIQQQIQAGFFPKNASILCIHTGGLQGNASVAGKLVY